MASGPVIIGYDGSPAAARALVEAAGLLTRREVLVVVAIEADGAFDRRATPVPVAAVPPCQLDIRNALRADDEVVEQARWLVQRGVAIATEAGFEADGLAVADDVPVAQTLLRVADEQDAPVLVVGAHRRGGFGELLIGSTARDLLGRSPRPVLAVGEEDSVRSVG
jgi:nucleotide-binding universal stress UspA family protein